MKRTAAGRCSNECGRDNALGIPLARDIAIAIRAQIREVTGLNASAGIPYNKFLAKLASAREIAIIEVPGERTGEAR